MVGLSQMVGIADNQQFDTRLLLVALKNSATIFIYHTEPAQNHGSGFFGCKLNSSAL